MHAFHNISNCSYWQRGQEHQKVKLPIYLTRTHSVSPPWPKQWTSRRKKKKKKTDGNKSHSQYLWEKIYFISFQLFVYARSFWRSCLFFFHRTTYRSDNNNSMAKPRDGPDEWMNLKQWWYEWTICIHVFWNMGKSNAESWFTVDFVLCVYI